MKRLADWLLDLLADRIAKRVAMHNTTTKLTWNAGDLYVAVTPKSD